MSEQQPSADHSVRAHRGACHCGNLRWTLASALAPDALPARACQCSFCARHGALSTSDPAGHMRFEVDDPALLLRYRFATASADFLICRRCGVYVGALMAEGGAWYAIANLNTLEGREALHPAPQAMVYDGEDAAARRGRRSARWTPAESLPTG
jgi:hypothetical protein